MSNENKEDLENNETKLNPSSNLYPTTQLEQLEKQAREKYLTECIKNFKFNPSAPHHFNSGSPAEYSTHSLDEENEGIKDLKLLHSMITKRFTGKPEDLQVFLDQINNARELCAISQRRNLLALIFNAIEGEPRETLRERPDIQSYTQLVTFLKEHYEPRESFAQAYSRLSNAKQDHNETVRQFGDRLIHLAYLAKNASKKERKLVEETILENGRLVTIPSRAATHMIEFTALERFKVGTKLEISRFIRCNPYADTLNKAIHEAVEFEAKEIQEKSLRGNSRPGNCRVHGPNCGHTDRDCRVQQHKKTSNEKYCSYCKIPGHTRDECRKRQRDEENKRSGRSSSTLVMNCSYCKKNGHTIRDCKTLERRKRENPEKYDRSHPDYIGPKPSTNTPRQPSQKTETKNSSSNEVRQVNICSRKRAVICFTTSSQSTIQLLVDPGAEDSLIKLSALDPETRAKIDRKTIINLDGITDSNTQTIGKVPIRVTIDAHTYEFDFHVIDNPLLNIPLNGLFGDNLIQATRSIINYDDFNIHMNLWNVTLPLYHEYQLAPQSRSVLTIETQSTTLNEGIIDVDTNDAEILIVPEIGTIVNNRTQVVAINTSSQPKTIALPRIVVSQPSQILTVEHEKTKNRLQILRENIKLDHLAITERKRLMQLIESYAEIFFLQGDRLQSNVKNFHEIRTKENSLPIHVKNYRFPEIHKAEVESQMEELLKQGIIQPSESAWNAPIWVVPKKKDNSGKQKWRIVVDYRRLNEITHPDKYPLPNIDDIFDALHNATLFTTIDLASGFHQIAVHPRDIEKTAFSTHRGHYEFNRMPFGLINAPATFQRVMNQALTGTIGSECFVYLDDIIVFSNDFETHLRKLNTIFQRLKEHKLLIQLDKTEFLKTHVLYLGHTLSADGLGLQQIKVDKIANYPRPTNVKEVQRLLGMTGYYRRFIANYSKKTKSLTQLTRKGIPFQWSEQHENDFQNLRTELSAKNLVLQFPDFSKEFFLNTDASDYAIGSVLSQEDNEGNRKPIAFASRTLNKAEINYATIEKELLSIVWSTKHFRPYLYGRRFTILSDHKPLQWLFNITDPGSRLLRWRLKLEEYDYTIKHVSGTQNSVADALSRIHILQIPQDIESMKTMDEKEVDIVVKLVTEETQPNLKLNEFKMHRKTLTYCFKKTIISPFDTLSVKTTINAIKQLIVERKPRLIGILDTTDSGQYSEATRLRTERILQTYFQPYSVAWIRTKIPHNKESLIRNAHTHPLAIHPGINRMYKQFLDNGLYWRNMKNDIAAYVNSCSECQQNKHSRQPSKLPLVITDTSTEPFQKISLDFVGPLPLTINGNQHVLTLQDDLTKFIILHATPTTETALVAKHLISIFCQYGIPEALRTDQGIAFCSNIVKEITSRLGIRKLECTPYHPESNGALERSHGTIKQSVRFQINTQRNDWDEYLDITAYSFNTAVHSATNKTPYELLFGIKPRVPYLEHSNPERSYEDYATETKARLTELRQKAIDTQIINKERSKKRYDKHNHAKFSFTPGDSVRLVTRNIQGKRGALSKPYEGPYKVTSVNYPNVTIELDGKEKTFHGNLLRPFTSVTCLQICLFFLLLPLTLCQVTIDPIYTRNGLFHQNLGIVDNHVADYTLLTGFSLTQTEANLQTLIRIKNNVESLAKHIDTTLLTEEQEVSLQNLRTKYSDLTTSTGYLHNRPKRQIIVAGASLAIGWIASKILGASAEITDLQKDEKTIAEAVRQNIHLINTTVRNFENEFSRVQKNERKMNAYHQIISEQINELYANITRDDILANIALLKEEFLEITYILGENIDTMTNAVLFAKNKIIHPSIISSTRLRSILHRASIPREKVKFPLPTEDNTPFKVTQEYQRICTIESEIVGKSLLFAISIPLIEVLPKSYQMLHILPFPFATSYPSLTYHVILPSFSYAVINDVFRRYSILQNPSDCLHIQGHFLCQLHTLPGMSQAPCELGIAYGYTEHCINRTIIIAANVETWHFIGNNQWIFVLNKPGQLHVECADLPNEDVPLVNAGILTLAPKCTASTKENIFYPHTAYISNTKITSRSLPAVNFTEILPISEHYKKIDVPHLDNFNADHIRHLYAQQRNRILDFETLLIHNDSWLNWTNLGYVALVVLIIVGLWYYRHRNQHQPKSRTPPAVTFQLNQSLPQTPYQDISLTEPLEADSESVPLRILPTLRRSPRHRTLNLHNG